MRGKLGEDAVGTTGQVLCGVLQNGRRSYRLLGPGAACFSGPAGKNSCGRFSAGQVGRRLEPGLGKRAARWWRWLVAGMLISTEAQGQQPQPRIVTVAGQQVRPVTAALPPVHIKAPELDDNVKVKVLKEAVVYANQHRGDVMGLYSVVAVRSGNWIKDSLPAILGRVILGPGGADRTSGDDSES